MFGSACIKSGVVVSRSFPGMFWQPGYRVLDPHDSACTSTGVGGSCRVPMQARMTKRLIWSAVP